MDLQKFILDHIASVEHLRMLLLLRSDLKRSWSIMEVCARLYLEPKRAADVLAGLERSGLLEESKGEYRYTPRSPELAAAADELERLDRQRPVTLIKLIYSRPDTLEAFADAFRIRRDE